MRHDCSGVDRNPVFLTINQLKVLPQRHQFVLCLLFFESTLEQTKTPTENTVTGSAKLPIVCVRTAQVCISKEPSNSRSCPISTVIQGVLPAVGLSVWTQRRHAHMHPCGVAYVSYRTLHRSTEVVLQYCTPLDHLIHYTVQYCTVSYRIS